MEWSQRDAWSRVATEGTSQQGEGGGNAGWDCVPAAYCLAVMVLGGPDLSVPEVVDAAYGAGFHGPTSFSVIEREVRKRWPGLPRITYGRPDDTLSAIDQAAGTGLPVIATFHATPGGTITDTAMGSVHVCPVVAHADHLVTILNVEHNTFVTHTEAFFRAATLGAGAGDLAVFNAASAALPRP